MLFIRKYLKIIYLLALPVYFYISYNSALNKHTHVNANGIIITHSHPVDRESNQPVNDHKHSKKEICLFQSLNFDNFIFTEEFSTEDIHLNPEQLTYIRNTRLCNNPRVNVLPARAPPANVA